VDVDGPMIEAGRTGFPWEQVSFPISDVAKRRWRGKVDKVSAQRSHEAPLSTTEDDNSEINPPAHIPTISQTVLVVQHPDKFLSLEEISGGHYSVRPAYEALFVVTFPSSSLINTMPCHISPRWRGYVDERSFRPLAT
jgi:hypothetical protein